MICCGDERKSHDDNIKIPSSLFFYFKNWRHEWDWVVPKRRGSESGEHGKSPDLAAVCFQQNFIRRQHHLDFERSLRSTWCDYSGKRTPFCSLVKFSTCTLHPACFQAVESSALIQKNTSPDWFRCLEADWGGSVCRPGRKRIDVSGAMGTLWNSAFFGNSGSLVVQFFMLISVNTAGSTAHATFRFHNVNDLLTLYFYDWCWIWISVLFTTW